MDGIRPWPQRLVWDGYEPGELSCAEYIWRKWGPYAGAMRFRAAELQLCEIAGRLAMEKANDAFGRVSAAGSA